MLECVLIAGIGFIQIESYGKTGVDLLAPVELLGITIPLDGTVIKTEHDWDKGTKTFTFERDGKDRAVVKVFTFNHMRGENGADGVGYSDWHFHGVDKILEGCK
ncbi:hypothetical protein JI58_02280 [Marinosulfonomonas sp. PRT-SC04]|nr:hypothetical protein JI58_02280 [Marinosulfonomonas sp. PRT-SC04]